MILGDDGRAYGRKPGTFDADLTLVGPHTPMGEYMRRFWHPIGLSADAAETPRQIRVLGEDLIVFRDKSGRPGLLEPRCAHRGASLLYGKVEQTGIRCCYHGWLFDAQGRCLEQQCEPQGGLFRDAVRQPWYPLKEQYGLIWAYMGPAERQPVLPRYECLERLEDGEFIEADDSSIGGGGPQIIPCNWLQHFENVVDPAHLPVLHMTHSGPQFGFLSDPSQSRKTLEQRFEYGPNSVRGVASFELANGRRLDQIVEVVLPTLRIVPIPRRSTNQATAPAGHQMVESIGWVLPIDDAHFRIYVAGRVRTPGQLRDLRSRQGGKLWEEMSPQEHQKYPGDYEAQTSQGAITLHSEEHFGQTDRGVLMLRKLLREQIKIVAEGGDPAGVSFDETAQPVQLAGGATLGPIPAAN